MHYTYLVPQADIALTGTYEHASQHTTTQNSTCKTRREHTTHLVELLIAVKHYLCLLLLLQCFLTRILLQQSLQIILWHCLACMQEHAHSQGKEGNTLHEVCIE